MTEKPNKDQLAEALDKASYTMDKAYLNCLKTNYKAFNLSKTNKIERCVRENIRLIEVKRWVKDSKESIIDCFRNVLGIFSSDKQNNIALIINRTLETVRMYFAISNEGDNNSCISNEYRDLLTSVLNGNFTGSEFISYNVDDTKHEIKELLDYVDNDKEKEKGIVAASIITGIPSAKSDEYISQGIEKILEGIVPSPRQSEKNPAYTIVILAEPLSFDVIHSVLNGYEELASSLSPFSSSQVNISENKNETKGENSSFSVSNSIGEAITKTHSVNVNAGVTLGKESIVGGNVSVGYGYSQGKTISSGKTDTESKGTNYMVTEGTGEANIYTLKSYPVLDIMEKAEKNIKRLQSGNAEGLWKYATYVFSNNKVLCRNVAGSVAALIEGDESYIESPSITHWSFYSKSDQEINDFKQIMDSVMQFTHPCFENIVDKTKVSATSFVTTAELAALFAFPRKSVPGIPITECAAFGREPYSLLELQKDFSVGCAYHMHKEESNRRIFLSKDELTKHTFITGSTGSGKSNTIYQLIDQICFKPVNDDEKAAFMVIEPAKGEYKDVFGGRDDVSVYGTNPQKFPHLLQINPFIFPNDVHVLEHVDRLVEVFNACWPMYAAMPAILREAVERAYENCGWNLRTSVGMGKFPTFNDLLDVLPNVIDSSAYSSDTSNDYKGALITRVRSLTRGIHGMVFSSDIADEEFFNKNSIVDISRIGSQETKALIMGVLILRLQEFRMSKNSEHNISLRHLTVLEEAHNLLRRTSSEQSRESSNLQGKSVEMIANAIAEMRTYGEGFIIADQSPGLMDMSVIRNTNTKIIHHLPDESDRNLVGKAAGLNDDQIKEIARLSRGVAAVTQSGWFEPVLCLIDEFKEMNSVDSSAIADISDIENDAAAELIKAALDVEHRELSGDTADLIRKWYKSKNIGDKAAELIECIIRGGRLNSNAKMFLVKKAINTDFKGCYSGNDIISEVVSKLAVIYSISSDEINERVRVLVNDIVKKGPEAVHINTPDRIDGGGKIV